MIWERTVWHRALHTELYHPERPYPAMTTTITSCLKSRMLLKRQRERRAASHWREAAMLTRKSWRTRLGEANTTTASAYSSPSARPASISIQWTMLACSLLWHLIGWPRWLCWDIRRVSCFWTIYGPCHSSRAVKPIIAGWRGCGRKKPGHEETGHLSIVWYGSSAAHVSCCPSSALWWLNSPASVAQWVTPSQFFPVITHSSFLLSLSLYLSLCSSLCLSLCNISSVGTSMKSHRPMCSGECTDGVWKVLLW